MKDLKFTPGHWMANLDDGFVYENGDFMRPILEVRGWGYLSTIHTTEEAKIIQDGNLILAAKAPEMYKALKQAKEAMEYSLRGLDPHDLNTKGMIREALETINKLGL